MNSNKVNSLMVGMEINIRRTDGRIHSVIISTIDNDLKIVTVEWFEKGEAKGKEVDFREVFELNSHLMPISYVLVPGKIIEENKEDIIKESLTNEESDNKVNNFSRSPVIHKIEKEHETNSKKEYINVENSKLKNPKLYSDVNLFSKLRQEKEFPSETKNVPKRPPSRSQRRLTCAEEIEKIQFKRDERRAINKLVKPCDFDYTNPNFAYFKTIMEYRNVNQIIKCAYEKTNSLQKILVCVRKRPMNKKEIIKKDIDVITVLNKDTVIIHEPKIKVDLTKYMDHQTFRFDYVFDEECDNRFVYEYTAKPLVESIFQGGMATCFAYGQTGSGKTYTMSGEFLSSRNSETSVEGIYILAAKDVFELKNEKYSDELSIEISFFEIYGGKVNLPTYSDFFLLTIQVYDLLNRKQRLSILEDSKNQIQLIGLKCEPVYNIEEVLDLLQIGTYIRTSGQTSANEKSSRSHAVFQIILKKMNSNKIIGKFSLIDLAGNERGADTMSMSRSVRMEGAEINKSLLALKECIRALGRKGAHLPFRGSKLTLVLRDSFVGENSRTCMIALVSPNIYSCEHSLNTLRYADRVKELCPNIKNIPELLKYENEKLEEKNNKKYYANENSKDMINEQKIFEVTEEINNLEEEIVINHKKIIKEHFPIWNRCHKQMYNSSRKIDYNIDKYTENLEEILDNQILIMKEMKDKVKNLTNYLQEEEELNKIFLNKL